MSFDFVDFDLKDFFFFPSASSFFFDAFAIRKRAPAVLFRASAFLVAADFMLRLGAFDIPSMTGVSSDANIIG